MDLDSELVPTNANPASLKQPMQPPSSPAIYRIPTEILSHVIRQLLPGSSRQGCIDFCKVTRPQLGQVSRYWRAVVSAMLSLWAIISLLVSGEPKPSDVECVGEWFLRSDQNPLTLMIEWKKLSFEQENQIDKANSLLLNRVVLDSERWVTVELCNIWHIQPLIKMVSTQLYLPRLKRLVILEDDSSLCTWSLG